MSQGYRSVADNEIVRPHDVIVRTGVFFDSSSEVIKKLKEIVSDPHSWAFSSFESCESDFLLCLTNGYGNGLYRASRVKELAGKSHCGAILRLLPNSDDVKMSSYATPLPLP